MNIRKAKRPHGASPVSSFQAVGLHIDLRVQVMPVEALKAQASRVAELGFNTLLVEWEAAYPFAKHPIISSALAYSRAELEDFMRHCRQLNLDVIPLQQCFGHTEYILRHDRYAHLRESNSDFCQVCPCLTDEAVKLFRDIFAELAESHSSPYFHIGGDETYLLGQCPRCRAKAEKHGKSRLYVDYFSKVAREVVKLGKRPLLWADMLLKYPEAANRMPKECIFIDWNYGWPIDRFGDPAPLRQTSHELWGAPALRSSPDNHSLTCWSRHFENLRDFIPYAREVGYRGMILTSWSTSGIYAHHWDKPGEVIDLLPMRRVYPLAGFQILLQAFREAVCSDRPLDPRAFVVEYAQTRFGLSQRDGERLWKVFSHESEPLSPGVDFEKALRLARVDARIMHALKPVRATREFNHLKLMVDLRHFHVRFKAWEAVLQSPSFHARRLAGARKRSQTFVAESKLLARRFESLNRGELHRAEFAREHAYRFGRLYELHERLHRRYQTSNKYRPPSKGAKM